MKFPGYFMIVWDFIRYAREQNIPVGPGRGSAAGSLVAYVMQITDIDPLQNELLFERFLNPERISMPDIDIDFCMNRRGEVIEYVTRKYGRDQVAQIITFNTMAAKAAIKDVGRALDMPYGEVDRIAKMIPTTIGITIDQALKDSPHARHRLRSDPKIKELIDAALRLEGLVRGAGVHAAGVVIAPKPLTELVPVTRAKNDDIVTAYDMKAIEKMGLLKMDFLGLTTLTVIDDALKLIKSTTGTDLDMATIPLDDARTYEQVFHRALTSGVFQFESGGMRDVLRRYKPNTVEDLTALNALYRPGPIQGGMIDDFIERKWGRRAVEYLLPELEPILHETLGVIVYQEQVMQISTSSPATRSATPTCSAAPWARKTQPRWPSSATASWREPPSASTPKTKPERSSTSWRSSPDTASTSRTPPPTRSSPITPPGSRPTIPSSSWPRCSPAKPPSPTTSSSTSPSAAR